MTREDIENKIESIINSMWSEYGYHKCKPNEVLLDYPRFDLQTVRVVLREIDKCFGTAIYQKYWGMIEASTFKGLCDIVEQELINKL